MIFTIVNHGLCNRMRCTTFKSHHNRHISTFITIIIFKSRHIQYTLCKGTGFIHNNGIEFTRFFKIFCTLDEHTVFRTKSRPNHDRCWCSKAKRTRTCDNQYRCCINESNVNRISHNEVPYKTCQNSKANNGRYEILSHDICNTLNTSLGGLCLFYNLDDLRQHRIGTNTLCFHGKSAT